MVGFAYNPPNLKRVIPEHLVSCLLLQTVKEWMVLFERLEVSDVEKALDALVLEALGVQQQSLH